MRTRNWLAAALLAGLCAVAGPAPAEAAFWPFSLFAAKKTPPKKTKAKPKQPGYANRVKPVKTTH
jgi:hypothetical protein